MRGQSVAAGPGAWMVGRPTLHGGPVRLRPVRATPGSNYVESIAKFEVLTVAVSELR